MKSPTPVSALTAHLGFWLRAVSNHVSHAFAARLGGQGVTVAEWVLLRALLGRAPVAPSQLAGELGLTRGAITKLADRLIAKTLVARTANEADRRGQTLTLTAAGAALVPALAAAADRNDADFFAPLSAAERATLERLLRRLAAAHRISATPID